MYVGKDYYFQLYSAVRKKISMAHKYKHTVTSCRLKFSEPMEQIKIGKGNCSRQFLQFCLHFFNRLMVRQRGAVHSP